MPDTSSGPRFQAFIASMFDDRSYTQYRSFQMDSYSERQGYACTYRGFESIFGVPMSVDFYLRHPHRWDKGLAIMAKYQTVPGSTDFKLPYFVQSLQKMGVPSLLFLGGPGWSHKIRNWLVTEETLTFTPVHGEDNIETWMDTNL